MSELTTEAKLQKIIEAQVRGGYNGWQITVDQLFAPNPHNRLKLKGDSITDGYNNHGHILEILLDPQGCKAVWGEEMDTRTIVRDGVVEFLKVNGGYVAHEILNTWYDSNGDAAATIDTAYSLLPDPR